MKTIDLTGQRFSRLLVVRAAMQRIQGKLVWFCRCDCGGEIFVLGTNLRSGRTRSDGCLMGRVPTHGAGRREQRTPAFVSWLAMRDRCLNPKSKRYARYGGRGITICERWLKFTNFLADMGDRPRGTTIDRIDGARGYEPGNCRWAGPKVQARQNRVTLEDHEPAQIRWLVLDEKLPMAQVARFFEISPQTVCRIKDGKVFAEA